MAHVFGLIVKLPPNRSTMGGAMRAPAPSGTTDGSVPCLCVQVAPAPCGALVTQQTCPQSSVLSGKRPKGGVWIPVLQQNVSNPLFEPQNMPVRQLPYARQHRKSRLLQVQDDGVEDVEDGQQRETGAGTG